MQGISGARPQQLYALSSAERTGAASHCRFSCGLLASASIYQVRFVVDFKGHLGRVRRCSRTPGKGSRMNEFGCDGIEPSTGYGPHLAIGAMARSNRIFLHLVFSIAAIGGVRCYCSGNCINMNYVHADIPVVRQYRWTMALSLARPAHSTGWICGLGLPAMTILMPSRRQLHPAGLTLKLCS